MTKIQMIMELNRDSNKQFTGVGEWIFYRRWSDLMKKFPDDSEKEVDIYGLFSDPNETVDNFTELGGQKDKTSILVCTLKFTEEEYANLLERIRKDIREWCRHEHR